MAFSMSVFAVHRVALDDGKKSVIPYGAARRSELDRETIKRIEQYAVDVSDRDESIDASRSAWFNGGAAPSEIAELATCPERDFDAVTRRAAERLLALTPARPSSMGIVLFVREAAGDPSPVCIVKLPTQDVDHVRFDRNAAGAQSAITAQRVADELPAPKDMQKAALLPNPDGPPMRVLDVQRGGDPAGYWLAFLGAVARPPSKDMYRRAVRATLASLEDTFARPDPAAFVLDSLPGAGQSIGTRQFIDRVADEADVPAGDLWAAAVAREPQLATAHHAVVGADPVTRKMTIDLGGSVRITGPASALDPRMEIASDDRGWFVRVRPSDPSQKPRPKLD